MSELTKRVIVAVIGIPLALGLIITGNEIFSMTVLIIAILGIGEFIGLAKNKTANIQKFAGYFFTICIIAAFSLHTKPVELAFIIILLMFTFFIFVFTAQVFKGVTDGLYAISSAITCFIYIGFGFSSFIIIRNFYKYLLFWKDFFNQTSFLYNFKFTEPATWGLIVLFIFVSIWTCDSAAYFIGKAFGKHKLHPKVSPNKSWEGAIAGLIGSILAFVLLSYFFIPEIPLIHGFIIGLITGLFGQTGDLAESLLKRDAGIKDSSHLLPGHGGILDRFDSPLFVFPALTVYFFIIAFIG